MAGLGACGDDDRSGSGDLDAGAGDAAIDAAAPGGGQHDAAARDAAPGADVDAGAGDGGPMSAELIDNLRALGVATEPEPLQGEGGEPLPQTYSPLGPVLELGRRDEIFVLGPAVASDPAALLEDGLGDPAYGVLGSFAQADWPWAVEPADPEDEPGARRAAAAGEFMTTGVEEVAVAYFDETTHELRLKVLYAGESTVGEVDYLLVETADAAGRVNDVAVAAGDFDGDGYDDLAVGYVIITETEVAPGMFEYRSQATVLCATVASGAVEVGGTPIVTIPERLSQSVMTLSLAAGRLDHDGGEELAIVANEVAAQNQGSSAVARARARYFVLDDAEHGYRELRSGDVIGDDADGNVLLAAGANVALGDIDDDGFDEIVLGGLTLADSYLPELGACEPVSYVVLGLDDGTAQFRALGATQVTSAAEVCTSDGSRTLLMHHLHLNTLDVDGAGADEIQVNELILGFDPEATPTLQVRHQAGSAAFFASCGLLRYEREVSTVAVGDFLGRGRDQVLHHCTGETTLDVWGVEPDATAMTRLDTVAVTAARLIRWPSPWTWRTTARGTRTATSHPAARCWSSCRTTSPTPT